MSHSSSGSSARLGVGLLLLAIVAALAAYVGWRTLRPKPKTPLDTATILVRNAQGVGHMDRYEFAEAVPVFEKLVADAPDWLPGKVNLAIALINFGKGTETGKEDVYVRAERLLQEVLAREPDNPYAHFNLGYLALVVQNDWDRATPYFQKVTQLDPSDAWAWYWLGRSYVEDDARAIEAFRKAHELDPYNASSIFVLGSLLRRAGKDEEAAHLSERFKQLKQAEIVETPSKTDTFYTERGKYAQVIGRVSGEAPAAPVGPLPLVEPLAGLKVELAAGARWAKADDLDPLRRWLRERFGAVLVPIDYDGDGRPDLLLLGSVVENGKLRDLLLRNEGEGRFRDMTAAVGLVGPASLGCCVGDYDNDGRPDLLLTGAGSQRLFRNTGKGNFEDVTARAGLDKVTSVCLGAAMVDLEQDGDLDLVLSQYATSPEAALAALDGKAEAKGHGLVVFWNAGEAKPRSRSEDPPPLETSFKRADGPADLLGSGPAVGALVGDVDLDGDVDLLVLTDRAEPSLVLNDRLQRFHRRPLPESLLGRGTWNGALVLDADRDGRSDLLILPAGASPVLLLRQPFTADPDPARWFRRAETNSRPLRQAVTTDIDLDGWPDVVGITTDGKAVLLHNVGGKLSEAEGALGPDPAAAAVAIADGDCDGNPDVLTWSEADGLQVRRNSGNGNHGLKVRPSGHRRVEPPGGVIRTNADGIGVRIAVQAGEHWTGAEFTTQSAGLGQSHQPIFLGLGKRDVADLVRAFWPDGCQQAEFSLPALPCRVHVLNEANRKIDSCPILFTWDGERFVFVNDFLGAGNIGEPLVGGGHRPPRPEESVKIEPHQLAPREGHYLLKIAEPMNEVTYLDRLRLVVLDHPADVQVYPDERFPGGSQPPTQELLAFRQVIFPEGARDHRGRDVTDVLRAWDRRTVDGFARRSWIGFAEEHAVELDFGDRLAKLPPGQRLILSLAGWTDYPYPESILAAHQAGVALLPPVLERRDESGRWQKVADASFPAGFPRMMTLDVTEYVRGPRCALRLRTNMHVFWDQIFVAPLLAVVPEQGEAGSVRAQGRDVADARLEWRGVMKEFSPDGREPTVYDYERLDPVPVTRLGGRMTRLGDVTELLRQTDDRFVIFGPGDELTVRFDARDLPPLPPGWKRSFVLRTWGYCKDAAPLTAFGGTVEPLPFRAMSNYPYGKGEKHPDEEYQRTWNTRRTSMTR